MEQNLIIAAQCYIERKIDPLQYNKRECIGMGKNCICPESSVRIIQSALLRAKERSSGLISLDVYRFRGESRINNLDNPCEKVSLDSSNILPFAYISAADKESIK